MNGRTRNFTFLSITFFQIKSMFIIGYSQEMEDQHIALLRKTKNFAEMAGTYILSDVRLSVMQMSGNY